MDRLLWHRDHLPGPGFTPWHMHHYLGRGSEDLVCLQYGATDLILRLNYSRSILC